MTQSRSRCSKSVRLQSKRWNEIVLNRLPRKVFFCGRTASWVVCLIRVIALHVIRLLEASNAGLGENACLRTCVGSEKTKFLVPLADNTARMFPKKNYQINGMKQYCEAVNISFQWGGISAAEKPSTRNHIDFVLTSHEQINDTISCVCEIQSLM
ncbi:hypothetical protein TNCV_3324001 [Trichonephila clavipes]|nr:hypothetical protein TNCV_3324001 [Trichonephila clavipes]